MRADMLEFVGDVVKVQRDAYIVEVLTITGAKRRIDARVTGRLRLRLRHVHLVLGDRVRVAVAACDTSRGRIVHRFNPGESEGAT